MTRVISIKASKLAKFPPKNLSNRICFEPFRTVSISIGGQVSMCGCAAWMPTFIGNISDENLSIQDLLNTPLAQDIRQSILQGTYDYCDSEKCGVIANNQLIDIQNLPPKQLQELHDPEYFLQPVDIFIAGDLTCNLSCPSCRTHVIKPSDRQKESQKQLGQILRQKVFSKPTDREIQVRLSSSGEIFSSVLLMEFISGLSLQDFPNLWLVIQTNGLLAERNWHNLGELQNRVRNITVTIDATHPDTYEKLRRGGKWKDILAAMAWLKEKKKQNGMTLTTRMVVQKDNYQQIEDFYNFSKSYDADLVEYSRILDLGTMSPETFETLDVFNSDHPEFNQARKMIDLVRDKSDVMVYGGID